MGCIGTACSAEPALQVAPLSLAVTATADDDLVMVLRTPLGFLLGEGIAVAVDGREIGRLAFLTCEADGCVAPIRVADGFRSALRAGREMTLTFVPRSGDPVTARYSLIGFIAATQDLALSSAPQSESVAP
jgi:invasion protein IalB